MKQANENRRILVDIVYNLLKEFKEVYINDIIATYHATLVANNITDRSLGSWMTIKDFVEEMVESGEIRHGTREFYYRELEKNKVLNLNDVDWSKQHCGVHQASFHQLTNLMPDLMGIENSFPENVNDYIWDVKVHMLMPNQYPCIPNWHFDNIPRINNKQDFDSVKLDSHMYLWVSGEPLTEFKNENGIYKIEPKTWVKFTQKDEHRGTMSTDFQWRGFIRATHRDILPQNKTRHNPLRRHSQVYLDANNFSW